MWRPKGSLRGWGYGILLMMLLVVVLLGRWFIASALPETNTFLPHMQYEITATNSPTPTFTPTATNTPSPTGTATSTPSPTLSTTGTPAPTSSTTVTAVPTSTSSPTSSATPTLTPTSTPSSTNTATPTNTFSPTSTPTHTPMPSTTATPTGPQTIRASVASDGTQGNNESALPVISANSRYVVFASRAGNLVPGDTNGTEDIFVHDLETSNTERVSIASDGSQANGSSYLASISADGRFITFGSEATNLVPNDTNNQGDIFVHDRDTGETTRVSVASDGTQGNGSPNEAPTISADGRFVAFQSDASNLVPGDTNDVYDIFVHDRQTGETTRVSVSSDGSQGNARSESLAISASGRYVAFTSLADNLVSGDTNGSSDVFVHDRQTGQTTRVSVATDGTQANSGSILAPSISEDGRYVVFFSYANNLVNGDTNDTGDVFLHDRVMGETTRISVAADGTEGNDASGQPHISFDGRYVTFVSWASNLVSNDTNGGGDTFVVDQLLGQIFLVSIATDGTQGNGDCYNPTVSADGRFIAFHSFATNLVPNDTNGVKDVFVHDRGE